MESKILVKVSVPLRGLWFLSPFLDTRIRPRVSTSFRPLAGIMVLISCMDWLEDLYPLISFRPLAGIMVLILKEMLINQLYEMAVSVPLRGLWFLSVYKSFMNYLDCKWFPSPCGDYGSYQGKSKYSAGVQDNVSVPLRGLWFLSETELCRELGIKQQVSVPLRGLWFLSYAKRIV